MERWPRSKKKSAARNQRPLLTFAACSTIREIRVVDRHARSLACDNGARFEAEKDVFVEKPLLQRSRGTDDGGRVAQVPKRVSQMGNHIHNDYPNYRRVVEPVK